MWPGQAREENTEFVEFDLVANRAHVGDVATSGVVEDPFLVRQIDEKRSDTLRTRSLFSFRPHLV